ncbi:MAG: type VI secretion system-associated protein TagF [Azoarcus sp.]|nr:type VI secretion system-associated protein TagF [Azoarcus sp.]
MDSGADAPGWYGKLPALGDFASRRLPHGFVSAWDAWLQRGMAYSQEHLGPAWLDTFLTAPVWGFVLGARTLDTQTWAGIVLPSVDRVGRYFPLTLCAALPRIAFDGEALAALQRWMDDLEQAARAGLDPQVSLEGFDAAFAGVLPPSFASPAMTDGLGSALLRGEPFIRLERAGAKGLHELAGDAGAQVMDPLFAPYTLWWCRGGDGVTGGFACHGMPSAAVFARMLQYAPGQT